MIGHFQVCITLARVKEQLHWIKMREDVKQKVRKCFICYNEKTVKQVYHCSIANKITGLFHKVAIGLTFDLTTSDGYNEFLAFN